MSRQDPYRNFRFRIEIDGVQAAAFSEVTIAATTTDVIEYRDGTDPAAVRKLPGLHRFGNVTLKRGLTQSAELWQWHKQVLSGDPQLRRRVVIVVLDESGNDQVRFVVSDAWPVRYEVGALVAKGNDVAIETLELANEGVERVQ
jgi:phage tail-like protein